MGVDVNAWINSQAEIRDIVDVLALLDGAKGKWEPLGESSRKWRVEGTQVQGSTVAGLANLSWEGQYERRSMTCHLQPCEALPSISLYPRATARNLALCCGVASFFGGIVQFNDCATYPMSFKGCPDSALAYANDGKEWEWFQQRLSEVQPLTIEHVESFERFAFYQGHITGLTE